MTKLNTREFEEDEMKKGLTLILALVMALSLLTACGGSNEESSSGDTSGDTSTEQSTDSSSSGLTVDDSFGNADTAEYKWKIAIDNNVGTNQYDAAVKFAEKLAELSDGNIYTEIYAGQQLGAGTEVLEGLSFGMQQVCIQAVAALAPFSDYANIDAVPYIFSGYDHSLAVWSGELGEEMKEYIGEEGGFKVMGHMYRGARITTSTKKMETLADFKGFKLRVPNIEVYIKTWDWIDAAPTPLSISETFTAIQQGTVEGQENPIQECVSNGFYDVCPYFIKTNHVYSYDMFVMDRAYFESLPEDVQAMVEEASTYASDWRNSVMVESEAEYEKKLTEENGVEFIELTPEAHAEFMAAYDGFVDEVFPYLTDWVADIKAADVN